MRIRNLLPTLVATAGLAACSGQPVEPFAQYVDEQSGESFTHAVEPVKLVAERPALSRTGKDYLYVAPVSVSGFDKPRDYLWFAFGSSVDRRITGAPIPDVNAIVLVLDGMPMTFDITGWSGVTTTDPFNIGVEQYQSFGSRVTDSQLRRIAAATRVSAFVTNGEDRSPDYALSEGAFASWADFQSR